MTVVMHCHFSRLLTHSHPRNSTSVSLTLHKGREGLAAPVPIPVSQHCSFISDKERTRN